MFSKDYHYAIIYGPFPNNTVTVTITITALSLSLSLLHSLALSENNKQNQLNANQDHVALMSQPF